MDLALLCQFPTEIMAQIFKFLPYNTVEVFLESKKWQRLATEHIYETVCCNYTREDTYDWPNYSLSDFSKAAELLQRPYVSPKTLSIGVSLYTDTGYSSADPLEIMREVLELTDILQKIPQIDIHMEGIPLSTDKFRTLLNVPNLHTVIIEDNLLTEFPLDIIPTNLRELVIDRQEIRNFANVRFPETLEVLDILDNTTIDPPVFYFPPFLKELDLGSTLLDASSIPAFPTTLETLKLRSCGLTAIPRDLPNSLKFLDISSNRITHFPANMPNKLETLLFSQAKLSDIDSFNFPNSLLELDLSSNKITRVDTVRWPPSLQTLNLSNNDIFHIGQLPPGLLELDISQNQVVDIRNLERLKQLTHLTMDQNFVRGVRCLPWDSLVFVGLHRNQICELNDFTAPELLHLDIRENTLSQINNVQSPKLEVLRLQDNKMAGMSNNSFPRASIEFSYYDENNPQ